MQSGVPEDIPAISLQEFIDAFALKLAEKLPGRPFTLAQVRLNSNGRKCIRKFYLLIVF